MLGSPIAHSQSPALHRAAYAVLGLPWSYQAIEVTASELADFVRSRGREWRGLSLTMPLKHGVIPLVSTLDDLARLTGSANTILFDAPNRATAPALHGFNTDVAGIVHALGAAGLRSATLVHVLGSGATAASALVASTQLGAERVVIWARNPDHAAALVPLAEQLGVRIEIRLPGQGTAEPFAELVISTLPGGANAGIDFSAELLARAMLLDVAYDPWPSVLAERWRQAGGQVLSGLAMLVHQALLQVRIFVTGTPLRPLERENDVLTAMLTAVRLDATGRQIDAADAPVGGQPRSAVPES